MTVHTIELNTLAPLDTLYHHIINPRQTHDVADIIGLAQSISTVGLLQNLSGYIDPAQVGIGIVAGGRRLAALRHIADNPADFEDGFQINLNAIPLITTTDPDLARSWAGAEAATQRALHPADEIRAYGAMATENHDPAAIARAFGQTLAHVKRRLKLASLPHNTLIALREDKITLDAASVLTLCTTREQHAAMLADAMRYPHQHASNLKREILKGRTAGDDRRAVFVGAPLYTMEGGTVEDDLFSENIIFSDEVLLDRLFREKLITDAERTKDAHGYAQVTPIFEHYVSYTHAQHMTSATRVPFELPEGDAAELATLEERGHEEELSDTEHERMSILEDRAMGTYSEEDVARGTAFIFVDHKGRLTLDDLYLPRAGKSGDAGQDGTGMRVPDKPAITQGGMDDLQRVQLLALQAKVLDKPDLVFDLLAFQFAHDMPIFRAPFNLQTHDQPNTPSCTEALHIDPRLIESQIAPLTTSTAEAFTAFKSLGKAHRNKVLAIALSKTLNQPRASEINAALCEALDASPRTVWTPTAENHFKACSVPALDATWRELVCANADYPTDEMERFAKLKKGEKAKDLGSLFSDAAFQEALGLERTQIAAIDAWVPTVLRSEDA